MRQGVTARHAIETIKERLSRVQDVQNVSTHGMLPQEANAAVTRAYHAWVDQTERQLRSLFADRGTARDLVSPRYWGISQVAAATIAVRSMVTAEMEDQKENLQAIIDSLAAFQHLAELDGDFFVLDTHVMLHFRRLDEIQWGIEFDAKKVRLILPLAVIDEMDTKTYAANPKIAKRAGDRLRFLDRHIEAATAPGGAVVRKDVTMEVLSDPAGHQRRSNVDAEILDRAEFLSAVVEKSTVVVVSGDRGMRVRGHPRGIKVIPLSDKWRLSLNDSPEALAAPVQGVQTPAGS